MTDAMYEIQINLFQKQEVSLIISKTSPTLMTLMLFIGLLGELIILGKPLPHSAISFNRNVKLSCKHIQLEMLERSATRMSKL